MRKRRGLVLNSDDEDEPQIKRKKMKLPEEEAMAEKHREESVKRDRDEADDDDEDDQPVEDAKPIGDPIRVSGKGRSKRNFYQAFQYDGNRYDLEDPVLLVPEEENEKPYVAIIKEITQTRDGNVAVTGQWFYRPEEAGKKGGGNWQSNDTRELFYSLHQDEVPVESVMHKCVVHFIPAHKQLPSRKQHPGFIVQKVYDIIEQKLWKLTDKDYEEKLQHEVELLVQKTLTRLGDLPDIENAEATANHEDRLRSKRMSRRKNISQLDVVFEDEEALKSDQYLKANIPRSGVANSSEYYNILVKFGALTGEIQRDKWLEKLLQGVQYMCKLKENYTHADDKGKCGSDGVNNEGENKWSRGTNGSQETSTKLQNNVCFIWPDDAIPSVTALEKASHEVYSLDFHKYNQKMRQLVFNLKNNILAYRILNGELDPSKILNMSPTELKEGLMAEEKARKEPEDSVHMQMTDARCSRCMEKKVGLKDVIQAGHGDRYQLECVPCGYSWFASRDEASILPIDVPSSIKSVGTTTLVTAKFENSEEQLVSLDDSKRPGTDSCKKKTELCNPILETAKSLRIPNTEDNVESTKNA